MSYTWTDEDGDTLDVYVSETGPFITSMGVGFGATTGLPTDPDEVAKLLRAIVEATGNREEISVGRVKHATVTTGGVSRTFETLDGGQVPQ